MHHIISSVSECLTLLGVHHVQVSTERLDSKDKLENSVYLFLMAFFVTLKVVHISGNHRNVMNSTSTNFFIISHTADISLVNGVEDKKMCLGWKWIIAQI